MRLGKFLCSFIVVSALYPTVKAQQPVPTAPQTPPLSAIKDASAISLINQSLAAMGVVSGAITDSTVSGKISYPDGTIGAYKMETKGSAVRQQVDLAQTSSVSVLNGSQGFVQNDGKRRTLPGHITKYGTPYYFPLLGRMAAAVALPNASVGYVGIEAVGDSKAHHVILRLLPLDATPPEVEAQGSEIHVFLDVQSLGVVKTQTFHFSPVTVINKSICETYYTDYRAVQGVLVPYHITEQVDGQPYLEIVVTGVLVNSGVSAVDFQ